MKSNILVMTYIIRHHYSEQSFVATVYSNIQSRGLEKYQNTV